MDTDNVSNVNIVDIKMPFMSIVVFMGKAAIAAIPALIILTVLGMILTGVIGGMISGMIG